MQAFPLCDNCIHAYYKSQDGAIWTQKPTVWTTMDDKRMCEYIPDALKHQQTNGKKNKWLSTKFLQQ